MVEMAFLSWFTSKEMPRSSLRHKACLFHTPKSFAPSGKAFAYLPGTPFSYMMQTRR